MAEIVSEKRRKSVEIVVSNEDLLLEILLRLPVNSLVRFKCVSRHWLSLISDTKFCSNHTRINLTSSTWGIYYYFNPRRGRESVKAVSLRVDHFLPPLEFLHKYIVYDSEPKIVRASGGLFLCAFDFGKPFVICNVTTQKHNQLPQHLRPSSFRYHDEYSACLYLDPSKSLHYKVVLFGWYSGKGDYIYYSDADREGDYTQHDGNCYEIDIYSSESRSWKRKHFQAPPGSGCDYEYKALWNGAIHWLAEGNFHIRFELDTEMLIATQIPPEPEILEEKMIRYFDECCGHLFLIQIEKRSCQEFCILEMDKSFCWTVKFKVNMRPLRASFPEEFRSPGPSNFKFWRFSVLSVVKEDNKSEFALLLAIPGKIILYNLKTETFKVIQEFRPVDFPMIGPHEYSYASACPFMPTLFPI